MTNLQERALTSVVFVMVLLGSFYISELTAAALFFIIIFLSQREFYQFFKHTEIVPQTAIGIIIGLAYYSLSTLIPVAPLNISLFVYFTPVVFLLFIIELYRNLPKPIANISYTILGIIYIAIPFTLLYEIAHFSQNSFGSNYHFELLMGYFFILWANDTGAYLIGKRFGKTKLFKRISPKKTWEGSFGGLAFGLIMGYLNYLIFPEYSLSIWMPLALIIILFGSLGDLVESLFKRSLNLKDSGKLLPGHGGILDRFDGIFISVPMVYTYLKILSYYYT